MLCGTPSVTTTIGVEGMAGNFPWNGFVADDFSNFALKAVELYTTMGPSLNIDLRTSL